MKKPKLQTLKYYNWFDCVKYIVNKYGKKHKEPLYIARMHIHDFNGSSNDSYNYMPEDGYGYFNGFEVIKAVKLFMDEFSIPGKDSERECDVYISW